MSDSPRLRFGEGSVALPDRYEDRTVNTLLPANPQRDPNLSVARDRLQPGEPLADYVAGQVAQLKKKLPGYKAGPQEAAALGVGERALQGLSVQASYRSGAITVHQRQAVFPVAEDRALVFTLSSPRALDAQANELWAAWLASFEPAAEG